jgi:hypothetical protein
VTAAPDDEPSSTKELIDELRYGPNPYPYNVARAMLGEEGGAEAKSYLDSVYGQNQGMLSRLLSVPGKLGRLAGSIGQEAQPAPSSTSEGDGSSYSESGPVHVDVNDFDSVIADEDAAYKQQAAGFQSQRDSLDAMQRIATGWDDAAGHHEGTNALEGRYADEQVGLDKRRLAAETQARARAEREIQADNERVQQRLMEVGQVDPRKVFHDQSNFEGVVGFLSIGLGAVAGVRDGSGKNQALEQLNKVIERDIKAQEFNIATAQYKVGQSRADQELHDRYRSDSKAWRLEEYGMRQAALANKLRADMMKYKSPIKQAEYQAAIGTHEAAAGEKLMAAGESRAKTVNYKAELEMQRMTLAESARGHDIAARGKAPEPPPMVAHPTKQGVTLAINPKLAWSFTPERAKEWNAATAYRYDIQRRINTIRSMAHKLAEEQGVSLTGKTGWAVLGDEQKAALKAEYSKLVQKQLRKESGAAVPPAELAEYRETYGDFETIWNQNPDLKLQSFSRDVAFGQTTDSRLAGIADGAYDWNADFQLDKFTDKPAPSAEGYSDEYFNIRKGIEAGVAKEATWRELDTTVPVALELALKTEDWNPVELGNMAAQWAAMAPRAKEAGQDKTSKMLTRAAAKLVIEAKKRESDKAAEKATNARYKDLELSGGMR